MKTSNANLTECPNQAALSDYLIGGLSAEEKRLIEHHIADCDECLVKLVSCYESVEEFKKGAKKRRFAFMKNLNRYLLLAIIAFVLSFVFSRYFLQFLVAAVILGMKWIVDSKSAKILIMIYEAWRKGGEKEASKILENLDIKSRNRF